MKINFNNKKSKRSLKVVERLEEIENAVPGAYLRVSRRNVPHLVIPVNGTCYSVAYFSGEKFFRIFHPYPGEARSRFDKIMAQDVIDFFSGLKEVGSVNVSSSD